jgi:ADP-heptose:LPS heptosyltransferase
VLVCRVNRRLGNLVLLTPLLRSLAQSLPDAEIDVLTGAGAAARVLQGFRFVRRIEAAGLNGLRAGAELARLVRRLRARRYDLAIDPCLGSRTNRIALALCGARRRLGFAARGGWPWLTHAVRPAGELTHEALRPLELLRAALPPQRLRLEPRLDLALDEAELEAGRRLLDSAAEPGAQVVRIGFFTEAAGSKRLDAAWWTAWIRDLLSRRHQIRLVQILPPGAARPHAAEAAALRQADPRRLAAALAGLDLFVSADTGPMHLASAAGVPTLGLFKSTNAVQYRPYGPQDLELDVRGMSPDAVATVVVERLARRSAQRS